jgi:GTP-binding protein HflX
VPFEHGEVVAMLHDGAKVLETSYVEEGTRVRALVTAEQEAQVQAYAVVPAV